MPLPCAGLAPRIQWPFGWSQSFGTLLSQGAGLWQTPVQLPVPKCKPGGKHCTPSQANPSLARFTDKQPVSETTLTTQAPLKQCSLPYTGPSQSQTQQSPSRSHRSYTCNTRDCPDAALGGKSTANEPDIEPSAHLNISPEGTNFNPTSAPQHSLVRSSFAIVHVCFQQCPINKIDLASRRLKL